MAWQRKIPFGYMVRNGMETTEEQEAQAVRTIFSLYLQGLSYTRIAEEMMAREIRYHRHTPDWNKNMVKRILENDTYLGRGNYPRIIQDDDFIAARLTKTDRNTYAPIPKEIQHIRGKVVCANCGRTMLRDSKVRGRTAWRCQNDECRGSVYLEDDELIRNLDSELRKAAETPRLLRIAAHPEPEPSIHAIRIQNELTLALNRPDQGLEYLKALIFASAAENYAALPDPTPEYRLERLKQGLSEGAITTEHLKELFDRTIQAVRIEANGSIGLIMYGQTNEEKEKKTA